MRGEQCVYRSDQIQFSTGLTLSIAVGVFEEHEIKLSDDKLRYDYVWLESGLPKSVNQRRERDLLDGGGMRTKNRLEWTQEREDFFTKLSGSMEYIVMELAKLTEPAALADIIANNQLQFGATKQLKSKT